MLARLLSEHPRSQARQYGWLGDVLGDDPKREAKLTYRLERMQD